MPESDIMEQKHIFAVHFLYAERFTPGKGMLSVQIEEERFVAQTAAYQSGIFWTVGQNNQLISVILQSV